MKILLYEPKENLPIYANYQYRQIAPNQYQADYKGEMKERLTLVKGNVTKLVRSINNVIKGFWKEIDKGIKEEKSYPSLYEIYLEYFKRQIQKITYKEPTPFEEFKEVIKEIKGYEGDERSKDRRPLRHGPPLVHSKRGSI